MAMTAVTTNIGRDFSPEMLVCVPPSVTASEVPESDGDREAVDALDY
jgi:hypothetical protein